MIKKRKGFSLVELLVVVGIIGVLVTIILPPLNNARDKAKNASIVASLSNLEASIDITKYPGSLVDLCLDFEPGGELAAVRTHVEYSGGIWNCDSTIDSYRIFVKLNQDVIVASNAFIKNAYAESDPHDFGNYYCVNNQGETRFTHWPGNNLNYPSCDDSTYIPVPVDVAANPDPTPDPEPDTDPEPPVDHPDYDSSHDNEEVDMDNDDDEDNDAEDQKKKIYICHHHKTIKISKKAKRAHMRKGDKMGVC